MADPIERIASAVSDGKRVDWVKEKSARPARFEEIDQLALVDRIRRVHESSGAGGDFAAGAADETAATASTAEAPPAGDPRLAGPAEDRTRTAPPSGSGDVPAPLFTWGRLQALEKVGEGSGGEVYRAFDPMLDTTVALKLLRSDYSDSANLVKRFLEEARRLAKVTHPAVVKVHGADLHDGRAGLWTEFVRGRSLEDSLRERGALGACEAAIIGMDLCRALASMHVQGLVHRDVKTSNVMREDGGRIVLMDFGSVAESPTMGGNLWTAGMEGTPIYMAPEQLRGEVAGPATDIYGLGVLLYRLVTRHYPVEASSLHELSEKHRKGMQVPLRDRRADLPIEFVQVIERALRPDPAQRFPSAGAMEQALAATLGSLARDQERRKRNAWMLVAATAVVAVVGGVVLGRIFIPPSPARTQAPPIVQGIATPEPPAPLAAKATLMRRRGEAEEALVPGSAVEPGDRLSLLLRGTDSMYVYVLNEDTAGEVFCLFPVGGLEPGNPLAGHMEHRLPGDLGNETYYWNVTSAGGRESIVAIGSREPLPDLEGAIAEVPRARRGRPLQFARVNPMALRNLRGISGAEPMAPPAGEARRRLEASLEALRARAKETGQIWVWSIELENPPRSP